MVLVYREGDELRIEIYAQSGTVEWVLPAGDFVRAIEAAVERLNLT
jgi:hypothetical protein